MVIVKVFNRSIQMLGVRYRGRLPLKERHTRTEVSGEGEQCVDEGMTRVHVVKRRSTGEAETLYWKSQVRQREEPDRLVW